VSLQFSQTNSVTLANSTVETAISGTGVGSLTLPAGTLAVGTVLRFRLLGFHSSVSGTIRIRAYLGATVILDTAAQASASDTNALIEVFGELTCRTVGQLVLS